MNNTKINAIVVADSIEDWGLDKNGNTIPAPEVEPETCGEGRDGIQCEPQWNGELWFCTTCYEFI